MGGAQYRLKKMDACVHCKIFSQFGMNLRPVYRFAGLRVPKWGYLPAIFFHINKFLRTFFFLLPLHLPRSKGVLMFIFGVDEAQSHNRKPCFCENKGGLSRTVRLGKAKYFYCRSTPMMFKLCKPHDRYAKGAHRKFELPKYRCSEVITGQSRGICVRNMYKTRF